MTDKNRTVSGRRHTKEMKAIVLGLPRTGTTSLCSALNILGLKTYNYYEVFENKEKGHFQHWLSIVDGKFRGVGSPPTPSDFDHILREYNVVAASPCWMFVDELLDAYPDAKVILSTRPPEEWLRSLKRTAFVVLSWRAWGFISLFDKFSALHWRLINRIYFILSQGEPPWKPSADQPLLEFYKSHNDYVRKVVPRHKFLEFRVGDDWDPLCSFLDIPIPREELPHTNARGDFVEMERVRYWSLWFKLATFLAQILGLMGILLFLALFTLRMI